MIVNIGLPILYVYNMMYVYQIQCFSLIHDILSKKTINSKNGMTYQCEVQTSAATLYVNIMNVELSN